MGKIAKVLVLGVTGMLGSTVFEYLEKNPNIEVKGTSRLVSMGNNFFMFDAELNIKEQMLTIFKEYTPDYIINCIGIINKYCRDNDAKGIKTAIKVNSLFPYELSNFLNIYFPKTKVLQIATDCVFSGRKGNYIETDVHDAIDVYGKTKSLGEVLSNNVLNIRCSIIGREHNNKSSLLEWFLSHKQNDVLKGFINHKWNGVTTLQYAQFCEKIIEEDSFNNLRKLNHVIHYCPNTTVSKYELLLIFQKVFKTNYKIIPFESPISKDMTISSIYINNKTKNMEQAISNYKNYLNQKKQ